MFVEGARVCKRDDDTTMATSISTLYHSRTRQGKILPNKGTKNGDNRKELNAILSIENISVFVFMGMCLLFTLKFTFILTQ